MQHTMGMEHDMREPMPSYVHHNKASYSGGGGENQVKIFHSKGIILIRNHIDKESY